MLCFDFCWCFAKLLFTRCFSTVRIKFSLLIAVLISKLVILEESKGVRRSVGSLLLYVKTRNQLGVLFLFNIMFFRVC